MGQGKSFARLQTLREEIIDIGIYLETVGKKPRLDSNRRFLDFLWNTKNNAYNGAYLQNKENLALVHYLQEICNEAICLRNELSQQYVYLIYRLVRHYGHRNQEYLDLVQEGAKGLLRAVDTFDVSYGVPFEAYATTWIRKYLSSLVVYNSEVIRIPESHEKMAPMDFMSDTDALTDGSENQEQCFIKTNTENFLNQCVESLKEGQRNIIRTRYFSDDGKIQSLEKVGEQCGLSRERTRQLELEALLTLERKMEASSRA